MGLSAAFRCCSQTTDEMIPIGLWSDYHHLCRSRFRCAFRLLLGSTLHFAFGLSIAFAVGQAPSATASRTLLLNKAIRKSKCNYQGGY